MTVERSKRRCFLTLTFIVKYIETIKNDLKLNILPSRTMSALLTPKHGTGCLVKVLNKYKQESLESLQLYVF